MVPLVEFTSRIAVAEKILFILCPCMDGMKGRGSKVQVKGASGYLLVIWRIDEKRSYDT